MLREDRRIIRRMSLAFVAALGLFWAVATGFLWIYPTDPKAAHCISKTILEFRECLSDAQASGAAK